MCYLHEKWDMYRPFLHRRNRGAAEYGYSMKKEMLIAFCMFSGSPAFGDRLPFEVKTVEGILLLRATIAGKLSGCNGIDAEAEVYPYIDQVAAWRYDSIMDWLDGTKSGYANNLKDQALDAILKGQSESPTPCDQFEVGKHLLDQTHFMLEKMLAP